MAVMGERGLFTSMTASSQAQFLPEGRWSPSQQLKDSWTNRRFTGASMPLKTPFSRLPPAAGASALGVVSGVSGVVLPGSLGVAGSSGLVGVSG